MASLEENLTVTIWRKSLIRAIWCAIIKKKIDEINKKLGNSFTKTYKVKNHSYDEKEFSPDKFKSKQVYRRFIK